MMDFKFKHKNLDVNVSFKNCVTVLTNSSGSGKSFLLSMLYSEARNRGINVVFVDYSVVVHQETLLNDVSGYDFILMDNSDLYMTKSLYSQLNSLQVPVVMSLHNLDRVDARYCPVYSVHFDDKLMYLE